MSRKQAQELLRSNRIPICLEAKAYEHTHYALIIRRLCAGWTYNDAVSGHRTFEVVDGVNQCKCGSFKVLDRSLQTRSADEGMTHFFYCTVCKQSWKT